MSKQSEELFESVSATFASDPKVSKAKMFGAEGLRINGKVFAFLMKGQLVLKLPHKRVEELIATKKGKNFGHMFAPDKWRPMKEWIAIDPSTQEDWYKLTQEAKDFVLSKT